MSSTVLLLPLWGRLGGGLRRLKAPIPTYLAGRAGPVAQLLARRKQSTGLFAPGLGPQRGKERGPGASDEP
jgi:hypothetical protein